MCDKTVLVMVPTVSSGQRLMDVAQLLACDVRVQVVFGVPRTSPQWPDAEDFVRHHGGLLVSPSQSADLVLSTRGRAVRLNDTTFGGDLWLDRMLEGRSTRDHYRRCLGVGDEQRLVTVCSTWQSDSTFARYPDLCGRLVDELPGQYRVAAVLHPGIWSAVGHWPLRHWLADSVRAGLVLVPPHDDPRSTVLASDWLIGDHGTATVDAAAVGTPVSLATFPYGSVERGSPADRLSRLVPRLDHDLPLLPQHRHAVDLPATGLLGLLSRDPGRAAESLRAAMYRLLDVPEPTRPALLPPLPGPACGKAGKAEAAVSDVSVRYGHGKPRDLSRPPR